MTLDVKRMAKACRIYDALLRYYPLSFQCEYSDTLALQFRDEYRDVLDSGKKLSLFRFWVFILIDFVSSLMREVLAEVENMLKKYFFVLCAIAAGIFTAILFFFMTAHYTYIDYVLKIPIWFQILIFTLVIGSGSLTMFGISKVTNSNLVFRILCLIVLVTSLSFLPIPGGKDPWGQRRWGTLIEILGGNEDHAITIPAYGLLIGTVGVVTMVKKKWLPGTLLLSMLVLPFLINLVAQLFSVEINFLEYNQQNWYTLFFIIFSGFTWFIIAGWLWKENGKTISSEALDTA